jgi:outer membrane protein assembly factor BamB
MPRRLALFAVVAILLFADAAWSLIIRLTPLREVLAETPIISTAKIEKLDPERPSAVLALTEDLKGKLPFRRLPINLTGDAEAKKLKHTPQLLKRLAPDLPLVLFATQNGKQHTIFAYTNGTWFQMIGRQTDGVDTIVWAFTHCEPYFRRTFKGTTAELRQIVVDAVAGKKKPPEPDPKEPPGLGPEVKQESGIRSQESGGSEQEVGGTRGPSALFAVIPTLGGGGILAILALLFPSLFGGALVLMKRWLAFFTIVGAVSLIYLAHQQWGSSLLGNSWWTSPMALWLILTLITLAGTLWAWYRHLKPDTAHVPERTEHAILWLLSLTCLSIAAIAVMQSPPPFDVAWNLFLVFALGIWAGTLYKLLQALVSRSGAIAVPTEGVILWTTLVGFVGYAAARPQLSVQTQGIATSGDVDARGRPVARLQPGFFNYPFTDNRLGLTFSTPQIVGDRAYLAAAQFAGFNAGGAVYCIDLPTSKVLWTFNDDGAMKQVFSSPVVEDGRLYIGEGLHEDLSCHLYCLDVQTGKKLWSFQTGSHTEATPNVVEGKVYCGAGDDGVYCLDAKTGAKLWQFPDPKGAKELTWHVDSTPAVAGNRVFIGGGFDEDRDEDPGDPAIACLDAKTGKRIWQVRTPKTLVSKKDGSKHHVPAWGSPVVHGGLVFFGLGTVRLNFVSVKYETVGALWCVDAGTGKEVWLHKLGHGVLCRPTIDEDRVYFGSLDKNVYCVSRDDGRVRWSRTLSDQVLSCPVLAPCTSCRQATGLYVSSLDTVYCFDPATGKKHWQYDLSKLETQLYGAPIVQVTSSPEGDRRRILFSGNFQVDFNSSQGLPVICALEDLLPSR